jgi:hypothetical protein
VGGAYSVVLIISRAQLSSLGGLFVLEINVAVNEIAMRIQSGDWLMVACVSMKLRYMSWTIEGQSRTGDDSSHSFKIIWFYSYQFWWVYFWKRKRGKSTGK